MQVYIDKKNRFIEGFNEKTGFYARSGVIKDELWENFSLLDLNNPKHNMSLRYILSKRELIEAIGTPNDAFMRDFPQLIDVGIMGSCKHGESGLCISSGVQCYQNGLKTKNPNMSLENFKKIVDECKGRTFQFALGGRGDVDQHEDFEGILEYCTSNNIIPNFTSSGLGFTQEIVDICKKYCGAIAISWYRQQHTLDAINMLLNAGVKTNIHYVLGNNSIDEAIERLKNNSFPKGINAIIFLLHKPVGLGKQTNCLNVNDPKVKEFYELIDKEKFDFKVGFDSCNASGIVNFCSNINLESIDYCESGRHSTYIDAQMNMMPCSFANQDSSYFVSLVENTVESAWNSDIFNKFRNHFKKSCPSCKDRDNCRNGCPIVNEITLCDREERSMS